MPLKQKYWLWQEAKGAKKEKESNDTSSHTELTGGTSAVKVALIFCQFFLVVVF